MKMRSALFAHAVLAALALPAAMTSSDAVVVILNSKNAVSAKTYAEARRIVEREAEEGRPLQQFVIGVTTDDRELAARYLDAARPKIHLMASERNNPLAWYLLSVEKNSLKLLEKAASGGNVQALNALGTVLMQEAILANQPTNVLAQTFRRSFECFKQAALQRDPNAYINLGTCYLRGYGCAQDREMAFLCFQSAAEAGHPEGMDNLSGCYKYGYGVARDEELSLRWMMRARVLRGDQAAERWLKERQ